MLPPDFTRILVELKDAVTLVEDATEERVMVPVKPEILLTVMLEVPATFGFRIIVTGFAATLKGAADIET